MADNGPAPEAFLIARICEEFHCLPTEAIRELRRAPDGVIAQVMEARAFAQAYHLWDGAKDKSQVPSSPMVDLVMEIEMTERHRQLQARKERA